MNCKHCGGTNPPEAKTCQFCGSELEEKETVYVPVHDAPPPAAGFTRSHQDAQAGKATALAILSLVMGFVVVRAILAGVALSMCRSVIKESQQQNVAAPSTVKTAQTISIISLVIAGVLAIYVLIALLTHILTSPTTFSGYYY